ncbi:MAG: putative porin [Chitinophagales bacterium]
MSPQGLLNSNIFIRYPYLTLIFSNRYMKQFLFRLQWAILNIVLCTTLTYAQLPNLGNGGGGGFGGGSVGGSGGTSKPILQKDTLNIDARYDTISFSTHPYTLQLQKIDTSITDLHRYHPALKYGEFPHKHLGNVVQAHEPLVFDYQRKIGFQLGLRQFEAYLLQPENVPYYDSHFPYSQIQYTIGPEEEQNFGADFAVHPSKTINIFLRYRSANATGLYQNQQGIYRNFSGSIWYKHPKKRYQLIAHYLTNNATVQQNGGVVEDTTVTKLNAEKILIPVNLSSAENQIKERNIFVQQTLDFGRRVKQKIAVDTTEFKPAPRPFLKDSAALQLPIDSLQDSISRAIMTRRILQDSLKRKPKIRAIEKFIPRGRIGYAFNYKNDWRLYDDQQGSESAATYYNAFYLGDQTDIDQRPALLFNPLTQKTIQNEVFLMWIGDAEKKGKKIIRNARVGLMHQNTRLQQAQDIITQIYYPSEGTESTFEARVDSNYRFNTGLLKFQVENDVQKSNRRFNYLLKAEYALFGFNAGDFNAEANMNYPISPILGDLQLKGSIKNLSPDFVQNRWFGHYFNWDNDFKKTRSLHVEAKYRNPKLQFELSAGTQIFDQFIVFDRFSLPTQLSSQLIVSRFNLKKSFKFLHKFQFDHTSTVQLSESDFINLPTYSTFNSLYFQDYLFGGAALAKIGFDVHFNTDYAPNAYNPATGQFYLQDQELQFYPIVDAYVNVKIQRVRVFLSMQHLNQGFFSRGNNGYFDVLHYPMQDRALKFGVRWMFFD